MDFDSAVFRRMRPEYVRKGLGGLSVGLGLWWVWTIGSSFFGSLWRSDWEPFDVGFLFTMVPVLLIPGILLVVQGVRLFRSFSEPSLRWTMGLIATLGAFWLAGRLHEIFPSLLPERIRDAVFLFVSSMAAVPIYLFVVRFFLRFFAKEHRALTSLLSRGVLFLMAWQLWLLLSSVFDEYSPIKEGFTYIHEEPWDSLGLVVPLLVAIAFYSTFASWLSKAQNRLLESPDELPESD